MKREVFVIIFVVGIGSLAVAAPDLSKLPEPAKKDGVTYAKDIRPLFEASCFGCHGAQRQRGGFRLDSLEATLKGGEDGKMIIPGDSQKSPLVIAVAQIDPERVMPPKPRQGQRGPGGPGGQRASTNAPSGNAPSAGGPGPGQRPGGPGGGGPKPLTSEQVQLVRAWVDQGAK